MHEKLVAGLVTFAAITPICAVCLLGPAAVASLFMAALGWFWGSAPLAALGLVIVAGVLAVRHHRGKNPRTPSGSHRRPAALVEWTAARRISN